MLSFPFGCGSGLRAATKATAISLAVSPTPPVSKPVLLASTPRHGEYLTGQVAGHERTDDLVDLASDETLHIHAHGRQFTMERLGDGTADQGLNPERGDPVELQARSWCLDAHLASVRHRHVLDGQNDGLTTDVKDGRNLFGTIR